MVHGSPYTRKIVKITFHLPYIIVSAKAYPTKQKLLKEANSPLEKMFKVNIRWQ